MARFLLAIPLVLSCWGVPLARAQEPAERVRIERMRQRGERWDEGLVLTVFGATSVVAGAVIASIGYQDETWLAAGLGTAGWGAVNVPFGLSMMDLSGRDRARIESAGATYDLRALAHDQYGSAGVYAFNGGLDVFYIATGVLMAVLGAVLDPDVPGLVGYGIAMGVQGLGLLAFDVAGWYRAEARADRLLELAE
jgi:hypothetical protein